LQQLLQTSPGRHRSPTVTIRCRIDLRGASPEPIVSDAEKARARTQGLAAARYLGVSIGYHYSASLTA
jgi:hypothetical protein